MMTSSCQSLEDLSYWPNSLWQRRMTNCTLIATHGFHTVLLMVTYTHTHIICLTVRLCRLWQQTLLKSNLNRQICCCFCSGLVRLKAWDWCGAGWQCVVLLRPPSPCFPAPALDHSPNERHLWQFSIQPISQCSIPHHHRPPPVKTVRKNNSYFLQIVFSRLHPFIIRANIHQFTKTKRET